MIMKYQCQGDDLGEYLQEQQHDFCKAVAFSNGNKDGTKTVLGFADDVGMHDNGFCDTLKKVDIKLAEALTSVRPGQKVFILLDSCAAICASDVAPYFHGGKQACNFGVKGVDALSPVMSVGTSQPGAVVLTDDQGQQFIGRAGGGLRAKEGQLNEIIWSESQMLHDHNLTNGKSGAFITERHAQLRVAGGRAVDSVAKSGLFGIEGELIDESDPRWLTLEHVWVTRDGEYYPPKDLDPKKPLLQRPNLAVYNMMASVKDHGDQDAIAKQVQGDLGKEHKHHSMQPFTYLAALDLNTVSQERTLASRFCGQRLSSVATALKMNTSGHDVLSPKGRKRLTAIIAEDPHFQAPGARFDKHKQRVRTPAKGPLESRKVKAGDNLVFDFYPTGMTKTPNFAMIADGVLPIGMMYPCKLKSDLRFHVQDHLLQGEGRSTAFKHAVSSMAVCWRAIHVSRDQHDDVCHAGCPVSRSTDHIRSSVRRSHTDGVASYLRGARHYCVQGEFSSRFQLHRVEEAGLHGLLST
jgi:hypothetical protein